MTMPFKHLAFVIHGAPQIVHLSVDPHEYLVQVPSPLRKQPMMNPPLPDLCREHRTEPVPPETHRLVADVDATLEQEILDLT